jgi:hypothetical protein
MSDKSSDKKQTKLRAKRWQSKRFFLTKTYKDGLGEIIRRRLSGRAQHVALRILDRFQSTPDVFANLENLAGECGIHRDTLRKYMTELADKGIFRFVVPPYYKRQKGFATEIHFPTRMVHKWLRDNGFSKVMPKNAACSKSRNADKTYVEPSAKLQKDERTCREIRQHLIRDEGAAPARSAAALTASSLAASAQESKTSAGLTEAQAMAMTKLGAVLTHPKLGKGPIAVRIGNVGDRHCAIDIEFDKGGRQRFEVGSPEFNELSLAGIGAYYDDVWYLGTTERPFRVFPPDGFTIDVRVQHKDTPTSAADDGTVVGYGRPENQWHLLIKWDDPALSENGYSWMLPGEVSLADVPAIADPVIQSPTLVPVQGPGASSPDEEATGAYRGGERVHNLHFGDGRALGMEGNRVRVDFGAPHGIRSVLTAFLELIEPAADNVPPQLVGTRSEPLFRVGTKARHPGQGVGLITHIDGDFATVAFETGEQIVPLSSLEPAV